MVLPVGADGKVSFFTDFGATDLAVSVVGYYVDPDASRIVRQRIAADGGDEFDGVGPDEGLAQARHSVPSGRRQGRRWPDGPEPTLRRPRRR